MSSSRERSAITHILQDAECGNTLQRVRFCFYPARVYVCRIRCCNMPRRASGLFVQQKSTKFVLDIAIRYQERSSPDQTSLTCLQQKWWSHAHVALHVSPTSRTSPHPDTIVRHECRQPLVLRLVIRSSRIVKSRARHVLGIDEVRLNDRKRAKTFDDATLPKLVYARRLWDMITHHLLATTHTLTRNRTYSQWPRHMSTVRTVARQ